MSIFPDRAASPFHIRDAAPLPREKFRNPAHTASGEPRAVVEPVALRTLWFNTGTLCNLACATCYIDSSPTNDALVYITAAEVSGFLDEAEREGLAVGEVGLTGGEPFMNPDINEILRDALERGHRVLVLSNALKPMRRHEGALLALHARHGDRLTIRVSLDHHTAAVHEAERGRGTWSPALDGLTWLSSNGFSVAIAGRRLPSENEVTARAGYDKLLAELGVALDTDDPDRLVMFPGMDTTLDVPEITTACWSILGKSPATVMCATSRMVVHRRGEAAARVAACTLLPYEAEFDMGATLVEAHRPVHLNHPHCARFCVLGGASCSA